MPLTSGRPWHRRKKDVVDKTLIIRCSCRVTSPGVMRLQVAGQRFVPAGANVSTVLLEEMSEASVSWLTPLGREMTHLLDHQLVHSLQLIDRYTVEIKYYAGADSDVIRYLVKHLLDNLDEPIPALLEV